MPESLQYFECLLEGLMLSFWKGKARSKAARVAMRCQLDALKPQSSLSTAPDGSPGGEVMWEIYSHLAYTLGEHWIEMFLAARRDAIEAAAKRCRLQVTTESGDLPEMLAARPRYNFIEVGARLYLLQARPGGADDESTIIFPITSTSDDWPKLASFSEREQAQIRAALEAPVCGCCVCASLRRSIVVG